VIMIRQGKAEVLFPLDVVLLLHCCFALCFPPSRWESRSLHSHVIEYVLVAKVSDGGRFKFAPAVACAVLMEKQA